MEQLRETVNLLADFNSVAAALIDESGKLLAYNKAFLALLPGLPSKSKGRNVAEYFSDPSWQELCAQETRNESGECYNGAFELSDAAGGRVRLPGKAWRTDEGFLVLAEHDIKLDELTGLGNRRAWDEALVTEIVRIKRYGGDLSVILTDIDEFKRVNDTHGRDAGDRVLRCFAELIKNSTRQADFVYRIGGGKFGVLMPHTRLAGADMIADRIRTQLPEMSRKVTPDPVTASFGVAVFRDAEGALILMRRAEDALYRAKKEGRDCVITAEGDTTVMK